MSTTTLVPLEKLKVEEPLPSGEATPARNSLDRHDEEKLPEAPDEEDLPPPMTKTRLSLLVLGLCLSMFLVALDFV
jgi:hypothetical protein